MAVSSIFHNVILDTPEKVEAFLDALEASEADPYIRPKDEPVYKVTEDPERIRRLWELREKNMRLWK